jgi:GntR family transcriptional regulator / MocR family aminotransferase
MPHARAVRAAEAARAAGFEVPLLRDYCRTSGLSGLILGFGGCTDEQLDLALRALVDGLRAVPGQRRSAS